MTIVKDPTSSCRPDPIFDTPMPQRNAHRKRWTTIRVQCILLPIVVLLVQTAYLIARSNSQLSTDMMADVCCGSILDGEGGGISLGTNYNLFPDNIQPAATAPAAAYPSAEATNIAVFYNVFLHPNASQRETDRVQGLAIYQLYFLKPEIHYPVYVHSIGKELPSPILNTTHMEHHATGGEEITLHHLWEYCKEHPHKAVVYLHSKGSYHDTFSNRFLRKFLTRGALSRDCAVAVNGFGVRNRHRTMGETPRGKDDMECNHCSTRFNPWPHPHTPGNMWAAHCSYVAGLIDPLLFPERMENLPHLLAYLERKGMERVGHPSTVGQGRFALEHWIGSRGALLQPCDLYMPSNYTDAYFNLPNLDKDYPALDGGADLSLLPSLFDLQPAPRFEWEVYFHDWESDLTGLEHRWREYQALYNETPPLPWESSCNGSRSDGYSTSDGTNSSSSRSRGGRSRSRRSNAQGSDCHIWWGWRMKKWVDDARLMFLIGK
jgi:hypothetical protein